MAVSSVYQRLSNHTYPEPVRFIIDGVITLPIALYGFLIFPDLPATTKAFYLTAEVSCPLVWRITSESGWANQICSDDDQERAVVLASMNMWNNVVNAWWPLLFYKATDAPRFTKGMIAMICVSVATLAVTWFVWYMERREHKVKRESVEEDREEKWDHQK
ncbi:hypothetical protein H0H93_008362 [Arthromyces matolae]|nr:hypothetical protein H0H93_008362 [Arthromyces matolae]